jgi:hypothetical protein
MRLPLAYLLGALLALTAWNLPAHAQNIPPGTCDCRSPEQFAPGSTTGATRGRCIYQAHNRGDDHFNTLVGVAHSTVNDFNANPLNGTLMPQRGPTINSVVWWMPDPVDNQRICKRLEEADVDVERPTKPSAWLKVSIFYLQRTSASSSAPITAAAPSRRSPRSSRAACSTAR